MRAMRLVVFRKYVLQVISAGRFAFGSRECTYGKLARRVLVGCVGQNSERFADVIHENERDVYAEIARGDVGDSAALDCREQVFALEIGPLAHEKRVGGNPVRIVGHVGYDGPGVEIRSLGYKALVAKKARICADR